MLTPGAFLVVVVLLLPPDTDSWRSQLQPQAPRRNNYNPYGEPESGLGAPCDYDEDCYVMEHTFCKMQQTCQCKTGFTPSPSNDRCLATIGAKCTTKFDCASLGSAGDCRQNVCDCVGGYLPGPGNSCLKGAMKLNDACEEDIQCQPMDATCVNRRCQCRPGHHFTGNKCFQSRALHESCDSNDQCFIGEEFKGVVNCYMGTCRCQHNYVETADHRCSGSGTEGLSAAFVLTAAATLVAIGAH